MDYEFWFWILITFFIGLKFPKTIYIGPNEEKYKKADLGILLGNK